MTDASDSRSDTESEELRALLRLAARGDSDAWRGVVARIAPRVFGLMRAQCRDPELAEEITQSTFCTLAAKIGEYVESGRFEPWVFRIAMNRLRDEMRRRARQARSMDGEPLQAMSAKRGGGIGRGISEEVVDRLERAMARLPESDREIIELRHTGGLSFKQLSDYYGEPVGTLLARHHRALRKLRSLLEDMGVTAEEVVDGGAE